MPEHLLTDDAYFFDSQIALETRLKPTWDWVLTVMDATEAQLRFGASLTHSTDPSHPLHPLHLNSTQTQSTSSALGNLNVLSGSSQSRTRLIDPNAGHSSGGGGGTTRIVGFSSNADNQRNFDRDNYAQSSRREFLTYALSLMRSHSSEHRDSLPVLDITALRHIAYVVDGIVFYMRSGKESEDKSDNNYWADADDNENTDDTEDELQMACDNDDTDDDVLSTVPGSRHTFFQRSESTLCLGCPPPDPFNVALKDALPLADQPHLLQPNACREDLFGIPKQPVTIDAVAANVSASPLEVPPTRLGLSAAPQLANNSRTTSEQFADNERTVCGQLADSLRTMSEQFAENEQTLSIEIDEKTDKSQDANAKTNDAPASASGASSSSSSGGVAAGGTEQGGSSGGRRQNENHNIYLQLKKKTYFDFHDEESKSNSADGSSGGSDKRNEGPQDLSKSSTFSKMEIDSDNDLTDSESDGRSQPNTIDETSGGAGVATTVRPQIIVSARKAAANSDAAKVDVKNEDAASTAAGSGAAEGAANVQNSSNSSSPSKSVIVRAGPSVSDHYLQFCTATFNFVQQLIE